MKLKEGILIEIINILGNFLSEEIKISPAAARGLIKLSIKEEMNPFIKFDTNSAASFLYT